MKTAATSITHVHELRMAWNNNLNFLDISYATARIFRNCGYKIKGLFEASTILHDEIHASV